MSAAEALPEAARAALARFLGQLEQERASVSSVTDPERGWLVHVEDSLSGLAATELAEASRIADLGSGSGFPGVALAVALPGARVELIESVGRKCDFLERALEVAGIENAAVVCERSETWGAAGGREAYDAVTARAIGGLATVAELAAPLLRREGLLVAWKGARSAEEERRLASAGPELGMRPERVLEVVPYAGSRPRHLHLIRKVGDTPARLPRRPGMARKRPLGGAGGRRGRG